MLSFSFKILLLVFPVPTHLDQSMLACMSLFLSSFCLLIHLFLHFRCIFHDYMVYNTLWNDFFPDIFIVWYKPYVLIINRYPLYIFIPYAVQLRWRQQQVWLGGKKATASFAWLQRRKQRNCLGRQDWLAVKTATKTTTKLRYILIDFFKTKYVKEELYYSRLFK